MKRLRPYLKGYLKESILGPLFKLLEALFELLVPLLIANMIDISISQHNSQGILRVVLTLFGLATIGLLLSVTAQYFSSKAAVGFTRQMTDDLFKKIMFLSKEDQDHLGYASLLSRLTSDSFQIQTGINQFLRLFLRAPIIVCGATVMAYWISPSLTLWFVMMVIVLLTLVFVMSHLLGPLYLLIRRETDHLVRLTSQQLQGIRVIKAFNQTQKELQAFKQQNMLLSRHQYQAATLANVLNPMTFLVVNLTLLILIWQGSWQVAHRSLSQGMLVALINYLLQILAELLKMTMLMGTINQSVTAAKRINQVFVLADEAPLPSLKDGPISTHLLTIRHLTFTYPGAAEPSLYDIQLSADQGEWIGIIGGTGAGKTTLIDLICQTYSPYSGEISLNWQGEVPKTLTEWRNVIALVPQKAQLFKGTIRSNLLLGQSMPISDEELWRALELAQAKEFVAALPEQLEAPVEAFGRHFSGGQRQRLAIARMFLKKPKVLILDEATSSIDIRTEAVIQEALKELMRGRTSFIIAHRLSTIQSADLILVMDQGRLVEWGTHASLMSKNGCYARLQKIE
ncbi:TPA: ABC transporter ATP-binding protein [Streptococcus pyogenes NGAS187]|nr:ABC transporter ATP-binding protein [Streptococcus pyogenes NGAS501]HER4638422.1 ABC transporter ATP-binding protein [Streptococcus pyogenes NGAS495]HER4647274.1 ABC transporter ATP-binding protein [Streptococcus pyogenes NGAS481]HER4741659.1 ABC transporter ATP-binding protein [Streptococcus pyogenes NGAS240]HER4755150.1 ABC transporter ATP-binding protein [Streptococcus pyogenes NGAS241]HER4773989.1 ABC transporter ATP-binding protein [Streptococcus pyogenes NGAS187]